MRKTRKIIGICGSYLFNQQPIQFINALLEEGLKYGYYLTALSCGTDSETETEDTLGDYELIKLIRHLPLSGMVILSATICNLSVIERIVRICSEKKIPVFSVDMNFDGCYNMMADNAGGFEQMVRHVIEVHGCRRINMLAGFKNSPFSQERVDVFRKVLKEHNIPLEEEQIGYGDFWEIPAREAVREFLNSPLPMPEAIVCANDSMAIAAYAELREAGYDVPGDILLTGFDSISNAQYHYPAFTTCKPDFREASSFIIHEIESFLAKGSFVPHEHKINTIPQIRQSCGCMPDTIYNMTHIISKLYENSGDSAWHNTSMNRLITANLCNNNVTQLTAILPEHLHMWMNHFRFACVKSSMLSSCDIPDDFSEMVSILNVRSGSFAPTGELFPVEDFIPHIDDVEDTNILIVKLLNSGKTTYGYSVEGFRTVDERGMQRCNDFAFSLSYCLNNIVHNGKQKELTDNLIKTNHEISMISLQDPMTRLFNRRGFYHEIEKFLDNKQMIGNYFYIFSIDMNHLKYINDTFGHAEGDFAITTLANAISKAVPEHAVCARFGGDEFIVALFDECADTYSSDAFCQQMYDAIAATEGVHQKPYPISASAGMSCEQITPTLNVESMIAAADKFMYEMKHHL